MLRRRRDEELELARTAERVASVAPSSVRSAKITTTPRPATPAPCSRRCARPVRGSTTGAANAGAEQRLGQPGVRRDIVTPVGIGHCARAAWRVPFGHHEVEASPLEDADSAEGNVAGSTRREHAARCRGSPRCRATIYSTCARALATLRRRELGRELAPPPGGRSRRPVRLGRAPGERSRAAVTTKRMSSPTK